MPTIHCPLLTAHCSRRQTAAAALLLYTLLAIAMMAPLAPSTLPVTGAMDVCNHVSGIIEARNALNEGQFPIRVPPLQCDRERYALFQFYGNFPYTLGGAVYRLTNADPYSIWKGIVIASLVAGAFFTYRSGRLLTRQALPAIGAGVVFVTAPYLLTDIHGRTAFPEIVSFGLLPAVFYYAWRSFAGRQWGTVFAGGVAWCLLALSHNITFLFGSLFLGMFFLSYASWQRRLIGRWTRVGAGYALGWLLAAWYLVPQQMLVPELCTGLLWPVRDAGWLTPLGVLLAPAVVLPVHRNSPYIAQPEHFGLQVGWLILTAVCLAAYGLWQARGKPLASRPQTVRLVGLFALALFMAWSPVDFWPWLPQLFSYVQFSYRLLMFVVLFGSLLAAAALVQVAQGRMRAAHLAALVLAAGWSSAPYLSPHRGDKELSVDKEIAEPDMGRGGANAVYRPGAACLMATTHLHPDVDWVDPRSGFALDRTEINLFGKHWAVFPTPMAGDALVLHGTVLPEAKAPLRLTIAVDDVVLATPALPAGPFALTLPLPPAPGKQRIRVMVHGAMIEEPPEPPHPRPKRTPSYVLSRFAMQPGPGRPAAPKLVRANETAALMTWGHPTSLRMHIAEPSLVQLPVLWYPHILRVEHNGQSVPAEHLGRWLALELPPGDHEIRVRVVGVGWANGVSTAAWVGVGAGALWLVIRSWRRRRRGLARPTVARPPQIKPLAA
jgi:hypothetical protein